METFPVIRLEIEGMRRTVVRALADHAVQIDKDVETAINEALTPDRIKSCVTATAEKEIELAIQESITHFFRYGGGRDVIKKVVEEKLTREIK